MDDIKQKIIEKIDGRLEALYDYRYEPIEVTGNQFEELNQAISRVMNEALTHELEDLKSFTEGL